MEGGKRLSGTTPAHPRKKRLTAPIVQGLGATNNCCFIQDVAVRHSQKLPPTLLQRPLKLVGNLMSNNKIPNSIVKQNKAKETVPA